MDAILGVVEGFYNDVLSIAMMLLLVAVGIFLTVRGRFFQFRKFGTAMKNTIGTVFSKSSHVKSESGVSAFQAVTTALAATIGTGSIAGVATALVSGGPGAIFWMWVSALLGMMTKYSEIVLSLKFREKNDEGAYVGGPMYYIKNGLGKNFKWLAVAFSIFAMVACIGTGNLTQANSISGVVESNLSVAPWITGLVLSILVGVVILGGVKRIASVNEKLVPAMGIVFVLVSMICIALNITKVPSAFGLIFREAFNFKAAFGGVAGYGVMQALRYGFGRGVFTNEAGLGSAPIAHAASSTKEPVKQGMWGIFEVFLTTIVFCSMSALIVLTSNVYLKHFNEGVFPDELKGAVLSAAAFNEALPIVGNIGVSLSTVFFSLSTLFGWSYYGEVCVGYLFKKNRKVGVYVYRAVYVICVFIGAVAKIDIVWLVADCFNALMALPNLVALIALSGVIIKVTKAYFTAKNEPQIKE